MSYIYNTIREYEKAIAEGERAVALEPNGSWANQFLAVSLVYAGRPEEAIPLLQKAIRLNPFCKHETFTFFGIALSRAGRFEEAVLAFKKALLWGSEFSHVGAHLSLAVTYIEMGRENEARLEAAEVLRINPKFLLDNFAKILPYKDDLVKQKRTPS